MPLILRTNKDEPLTHAELDGNLTFLDQRITSLSNSEANKVITWTEIQSKPALFDGDYNSLQNIPVLFDGDYNNLTNTPVVFDGNYQNLTNKPFIPTALNDLSNVTSPTPSIDQVLTWTGSTWAPQDTFDKDYNSLTNRPTIPSELSDLSNVSPVAPSEGEVLKWDGSEWAPAAGASGGIALTDISVTSLAAAGNGTLTYDNANGVFTYTPPDLTGYLTSYTETDPVVGAVTGIVKADGAGNISAAVAGTDYSTFDGDYNSLTNKPTIPTAYTDSDVDAHLNQSNPTSGYVLSWNGTDYAWVANAGGISDTDSLPEGTSNLYYTDTRFDARLQTRNISNLADVNTTGASDGQALAWSSGNSQWEPLSLGSTFGLAGNTGTHTFNGATETLTFLGTTGQINAGIAANNVTLELDADLTGLTTINTHTIPSGTGTLALTSDIPSAYTNSDVDAHLNQSNPTSGYVLSWNGSDYAWVAQSGGATTLSGLTDVDSVDTPTTGDMILWDGSEWKYILLEDEINTRISTQKYTDAKVDLHLNTSTATANQILSWDGADYAWVAGTDTVIAPFAFANVETTSDGSATGISWSNWNSGNSSLDFTFVNPQANTQYTVVTDSETFDDYYVGITNKTTTGFRAEFYDSSQNRTPSNFSPFTIIVYGETPTATITGSNISNASIGALSDVSISSATTGQVLKYNGSSWVNDTDAGGSVTNMASLTDVDSVDTVASGDFLLFDGSSSEYKFVAFESEVNGLIDSRTGGAGHISTQSQYTTKVTTDALDPTDTAHHVLSNTGTPSVQGASTAWYYGDVVSDPLDPTNTVVLDIDNATLTGNVMGELHGDVKTADGGTLILDVDAGAGTAMYTGDVTGNVTGNVTGFVENEFDLTGSTSSNYVFNADSKYFLSNTNNPTLYLKRGERYKFKNIDGAHPFRIQSVNSAGGTLYNDGVTNNGGTGTVTFIPPMDAPDELYYYCANHSAMNGVIKIVGEGGTAPVTSVNTQTGVVVLDTDDVAEGTNNLYIQTRTTSDAQALNLADESAADITIPCAKTFTLLKIQTSHAAWVTLYTDTASRTNDAGRDINTDPEAGSGVLAEVITSDGSTINITPGTIGWNNDGTPAAQVYAKVVNKSGSTQNLTVTLHYVALEV